MDGIPSQFIERLDNNMAVEDRRHLIEVHNDSTQLEKPLAVVEYDIIWKQFVVV